MHVTALYRVTSESSDSESEPVELNIETMQYCKFCNSGMLMFEVASAINLKGMESENLIHPKLIGMYIME